MAASAAQAKEIISFGPFSLVQAERLLTREGVRVELGGRALDILLILLSRANEVVTKSDLLGLVWPDVIVDEGSVRFHVASLRKALGDGKDGARFITTIAGRGYCFVAPISRASDGRHEEPSAAAVDFPHGNLPNQLIRMFGRTEDVLTVSTLITDVRFVTIVGSGGIGKTTVAIAVGHHLVNVFATAVLFVDLGMVSNPDLVTTTVASMLGVPVQSRDATPSLIAYLRDKRILLILDTCEHLVDAVATLASRIISAAPHVHILGTSREALQVKGEQIYKIEPLAYPADDDRITDAVAQEFPATQLFLERALASGARLNRSDAEAAFVGAICRKLGGVALAIELAARRVEAYGLQQTAALLDQRLSHSWLGPRDAPPRQKTLQATLDWSYELLSELERVVLRRLSIFVGHFSLDAALTIVTTESLNRSLVLDTIDSLVAKSMVVTRPVGAMVRYRLLDTTRAYVIEKRIDDPELAVLPGRHAMYYRQWLDHAGFEWSALSTGVERTSHFAGLNNVRAALEWCFGADGDIESGVGLAASAAPVFLTMSLLPECLRWSEKALLVIGDEVRGTDEEMHLQASHGISSLYMHGQSEAARVALNKSLAIAEARRDVYSRAGLLSVLHMFHFRGGEFQTALEYARRCKSLAAAVDDSSVTALAHSLLGRSLHMLGDHLGARAELEASLAQRSRTQRSNSVYLAYDRHYRTEIALARTLFLQGHPAQAAQRAEQATKGAERLDRPESLIVVRIWAASVFLWSGDLERAEELITASVSHAESQSLEPLIALARARTGELAIQRGDWNAGVEILRTSLKKLQGMRYGLLASEFRLTLAEGLAAVGEPDEALAIVDEALVQIQTNGDAVYMPEALRMKGKVLLAMHEPKISDAEWCFTRSLELGRRQGARGWELRTATDFARLLVTQQRAGDARALLQPVVQRFVEGLDTTDVKSAESLLEKLG